MVRGYPELTIGSHMQITPSVDSAMFYFSTNALHFSEEFFGIILLVDGVAQVLGECNLRAPQQDKNATRTLGPV